MARTWFPPIVGVRVLAESLARADRDKLQSAPRCVKLLEEPIARRLPFIINVRLVGQTKDKYPAAFYRLALVVECFRDTVHDIVWHRRY